MTDPMPQDQTPRDQEARDRIGNSLDENLFIEAGAGTGKTTALVGRMVALVVDEGVAVEGIAAITFTERAAAELGDRFRRQLEDVARQDPDPVRRQRADVALTDVDLASLSTLRRKLFVIQIDRLQEVDEHVVDRSMPGSRPITRVCHVTISRRIIEVSGQMQDRALWQQRRSIVRVFVNANPVMVIP